MGMYKIVKTEDCWGCQGGEELECEVVEAVEAGEEAEVVEVAEAGEQE